MLASSRRRFVGILPKFHNFKLLNKHWRPIYQSTFTIQNTKCHKSHIYWTLHTQKFPFVTCAAWKMYLHRSYYMTVKPSCFFKIIHCTTQYTFDLFAVVLICCRIDDYFYCMRKSEHVRTILASFWPCNGIATIDNIEQIRSVSYPENCNWSEGAVNICQTREKKQVSPSRL